MSFNLFVDKFKSAPSGWQLATGIEDSIKFLSTRNVNMMSIGFISHDLKDNGLKIVEYIIRSGIYPYKITFHCSICEERKEMFKMLLRTGKYIVSKPWRELLFSKTS